MNVISVKRLRAFWELHDQAEEPLRVWLRDLQKASYTNFNELHAAYPSADYVSRGEVTIFNIGGGKYRLVVFIRYGAQTVFVKLVMTHTEYDHWISRGRLL